MKKVFLILIILALAGGGFYFYSQKNKKPAVRVDANGKEIIGLRVVQDDSLNGWIKRKRTVQCKLTNEQGELTIKVKNDKVRIEGIPYAFGGQSADADNNGISLTDGDWVYIWNGQTGTKMNLKNMQAGMTEEQKIKAADYSWEDSVKKWESAYKYDCAEKGLGDDLFIPPTDVVFTDMTDMMTNAQEAVKNLQENLPAGRTINQEDIEAQMQKSQENAAGSEAPGI